MVLLSCGALLFVGLRWSTPPLIDDLSYSRVVRDREGHLLRMTLSEDEKYRLRLPLAEVPHSLASMLLVYEDQYFYFHPGVNPLSLARAVFTHATTDQRVGGSTITMQVARLHYKMYTRHVWGKFKQILAAMWLEARYSKKEILEAYFQLAPYGGNIEGLSAAAFLYFDKSPRELTLEQAAALLLIPQNPNGRRLKTELQSQAMVGALSSTRVAAPSLTGRWQRARELLITKWNTLNPRSPIDIEAVKWPLLPDRREAMQFLAPHFVNMVLERTPYAAVTTTTLDLKKQKVVETLVRNYLGRTRSIGIENASVLLVNLNSGEIESYMGSADFWRDEIQGQVDGVRAYRSPGSTLKPFIYALAMDQGLIHPRTLLRDTPKNFRGFDPENFERGFHGPLSATEALTKSRNVPAVDLSERLKNPSAYEFMRNLGVPLRGGEDWYGLAVMMGGAEITLENLLEWYTALARKEKPQPLRFVKRLSFDKTTASRLQQINAKTADANKVLQTQSSRALSALDGVNADWPVSPESSYLVLQMLKENSRDDIQRFQKILTYSLPMAWKTGTSSSFRDAWTIGVFGDYALGVWLGNFDGATNPSLIGREIAAPLFFAIAEAVNRMQPPRTVPIWENSFGLKLNDMQVCALTGGRPGPACTHRVNVKMIPGKSPISDCTVHQRLVINKKTGLQVCPEHSRGDAQYATNDPNIQFRNFEVWPSDLQSVLQQHGFHFQPPPPFERDCATASVVSPIAHGLEILSPHAGVKYAIQWSVKEKSSIPLNAGSDQPASKLSWFVGDTFVGQTAPAETLFWAARPGRHHITVTDNFGRSDSRTIQVNVQ